MDGVAINPYFPRFSGLFGDFCGVDLDRFSNRGIRNGYRKLVRNAIIQRASDGFRGAMNNKKTACRMACG